MRLGFGKEKTEYRIGKAKSNCMCWIHSAQFTIISMILVTYVLSEISQYVLPQFLKEYIQDSVSGYAPAFLQLQHHLLTTTQFSTFQQLCQLPSQFIIIMHHEPLHPNYV